MEPLSPSTPNLTVEPFVVSQPLYRQFLRPLGAESLTVNDPMLFFPDGVPGYEPATNPYATSPFFPESVKPSSTLSASGVLAPVAPQGAQLPISAMQLAEAPQLESLATPQLQPPETLEPILEVSSTPSSPSREIPAVSGPSQTITPEPGEIPPILIPAPLLLDETAVPTTATAQSENGVPETPVAAMQLPSRPELEPVAQPEVASPALTQEVLPVVPTAELSQPNLEIPEAFAHREQAPEIPEDEVSEGVPLENLAEVFTPTGDEQQPQVPAPVLPSVVSASAEVLPASEPTPEISATVPSLPTIPPQSIREVGAPEDATTAIPAENLLENPEDRSEGPPTPLQEIPDSQPAPEIPQQVPIGTPPPDAMLLEQATLSDNNLAPALSLTENPEQLSEIAPLGGSQEQAISLPIENSLARPEPTIIGEKLTPNLLSSEETDLVPEVVLSEEAGASEGVLAEEAEPRTEGIIAEESESGIEVLPSENSETILSAPVAFLPSFTVEPAQIADNLVAIPAPSQAVISATPTEPLSRRNPETSSARLPETISEQLELSSPTSEVPLQSPGIAEPIVQDARIPLQPVSTEALETSSLLPDALSEENSEGLPDRIRSAPEVNSEVSASPLSTAMFGASPELVAESAQSLAASSDLVFGPVQSPETSSELGPDLRSEESPDVSAAQVPTVSPYPSELGVEGFPENPLPLAQTSLDTSQVLPNSPDPPPLLIQSSEISAVSTLLEQHSEILADILPAQASETTGDATPELPEQVPEVIAPTEPGLPEQIVSIEPRIPEPTPEPAETLALPEAPSTDPLPDENSLQVPGAFSKGQPSTALAPAQSQIQPEMVPEVTALDSEAILLEEQSETLLPQESIPVVQSSISEIAVQDEPNLGLLQQVSNPEVPIQQALAAEVPLPTQVAPVDLLIQAPEISTTEQSNQATDLLTQEPTPAFPESPGQMPGLSESVDIQQQAQALHAALVNRLVQLETEPSEPLELEAPAFEEGENLLSPAPTSTSLSESAGAEGPQTQVPQSQPLATLRENVATSALQEIQLPLPSEEFSEEALQGSVETSSETTLPASQGLEAPVLDQGDSLAFSDPLVQPTAVADDLQPVAPASEQLTESPNQAGLPEGDIQQGQDQILQTGEEELPLLAASGLGSSPFLPTTLENLSTFALDPETLPTTEIFQNLAPLIFAQPPQGQGDSEALQPPTDPEQPSGTVFPQSTTTQPSSQFQDLEPLQETQPASQFQAFDSPEEIASFRQFQAFDSSVAPETTFPPAALVGAPLDQEKTAFLGTMLATAQPLGQSALDSLVHMPEARQMEIATALPLARRPDLLAETSSPQAPTQQLSAINPLLQTPQSLESFATDPFEQSMDLDRGFEGDPRPSTPSYSQATTPLEFANLSLQAATPPEFPGLPLEGAALQNFDQTMPASPTPIYPQSTQPLVYRPIPTPQSASSLADSTQTPIDQSGIEELLTLGTDSHYQEPESPAFEDGSLEEESDTSIRQLFRQGVEKGPPQQPETSGEEPEQHSPTYSMEAPSQNDGNRQGSYGNSIDIESLARKIYPLVRQRLDREKERHGGNQDRGGW